MTSVDELLKQMDEVNWSRIPDDSYKLTYSSVKAKTQRFQKYLDLLSENGVEFKGPALDIGAGPISFASAYPDTVGLDVSWSAVKELRRRNVRAIQGDIREMEFDENSFDVVLSFFPPQQNLLKILPNSYPTAKTWQQRFIQYTAPISRRHVVLHTPPGCYHPRHRLDERFLNSYSLSNLRKIPLKKGKLYVVDKKK